MLSELITFCKWVYVTLFKPHTKCHEVESWQVIEYLQLLEKQQ